ncbi:MAG: hypothetical protein ACR2HR_03450 [Euzebya sp.]
MDHARQFFIDGAWVADTRSGGQAEQAWVAAGAPSLKRPKPRLRRRRTDSDGLQKAA